MYKALKLTTSVIIAFSLSGCFLVKEEVETDTRKIDRSIKKISMPFTIQQDMQEISIEDRLKKRTFMIEHFYHRNKKNEVDVMYYFQDTNNKFIKEQSEFFTMELKNCSSGEIQEYKTLKTNEIIRICKNELIDDRGVLIIEEVSLKPTP